MKIRARRGVIARGWPVDWPTGSTTGWVVVAAGWAGSEIGVGWEGSTGVAGAVEAGVVAEEGGEAAGFEVALVGDFRLE